MCPGVPSHEAKTQKRSLSVARGNVGTCVAVMLALVRTPNFASDGPRRPGKTLVRIAVSASLLARRKPGVQIPSPPPHKCPGHRPGGLPPPGRLPSGAAAGAANGQQPRPIRPTAARRAAAMRVPVSPGDRRDPLQHVKSYDPGRLYKHLGLKPHAAVKVRSFSNALSPTKENGSSQRSAFSLVRQHRGTGYRSPSTWTRCRLPIAVGRRRGRGPRSTEGGVLP
jgi:hypothetical protein